ncbi:MAG: DUF134 domain-containing protein [Sphingobacteriia bacterium]|nr:DUF134 domain-containing protein [Sphingobacteriia bacterium]
MSPRPKRLRKISKPPIVSGFKPYGGKPGMGEILLHFEEYETIRLCDHENMNQHQAAVAMDVSRPTLTRIYSRARQKIASALTEGKQLVIEGGKIYFDSDWYICGNCGCYFNHPEKEKPLEKCPLCGSRDIKNYDNNIEEIYEDNPRCNDMCICPKCGYEKVHQFGSPCRSEICPQCNEHLIRKNQFNVI